MTRKKMNFIASFNLKLMSEDKRKINDLQETGINMSHEFRLLIRKLYEEQNTKK